MDIDTYKLYGIYHRKLVLENDEHIDWTVFPDSKDTPIAGSENSDIPKVGYADMNAIFSSAMEQATVNHKTSSVLIYGDPGIGKSTIVKNFAKIKAQEEGRIFIPSWSSTNQVQRDEMTADPEKYFVCIDIRAAQIEPSDIRGIPKLHGDKPFTVFTVDRWIYFMTLHGTSGILFLDELNQAEKQTLNAFFQVVHDREIGDFSFCKKWHIVAAGNRNTDNGTIPRALTNRFEAYELVADPVNWCKYARTQNVSPLIIAFIDADPTNSDHRFTAEPANEGDQFPSPRQLFALSDQIRIIAQQYKKAQDAGAPIEQSIWDLIGKKAGALCGVRWAHKFLTFTRYLRNFEWKKIVAEPDKQLAKSVNFDEFSAKIYYIVQETVKTFRDPKMKPADLLAWTIDLSDIFAVLDNEYKFILMKNIQGINKEIIHNMMRIMILNAPKNPKLKAFVDAFSPEGKMRLMQQGKV